MHWPRLEWDGYPRGSALLISCTKDEFTKTNHIVRCYHGRKCFNQKWIILFRYAIALIYFYICFEDKSPWWVPYQPIVCLGLTLWVPLRGDPVTYYNCRSEPYLFSYQLTTWHRPLRSTLTITSSLKASGSPVEFEVSVHMSFLHLSIPFRPYATFC